MLDDKHAAMAVCAGIAERVTLVRVALPTVVRSPTFQVGILDATTSTITCFSACFNQ